MNLLTVITALFTGVLGYILALAKDRHSSLHAKKMEAMTKLHDRVLEIEKMELSDGKSRTLAVHVDPVRRKEDSQLSNEKLDYMYKLGQWRAELQEEERKARLWLSRETVDLVGHYFILMMNCKSWQRLGEGSLVEDPSFLNCLSRIFGNTEDILDDERIVTRYDYNKQPCLVDCIYLSNKCLEVIQKRMSLEIALFPRLQAYCQKRLPSIF